MDLRASLPRLRFVQAPHIGEIGGGHIQGATGLPGTMVLRWQVVDGEVRMLPETRYIYGITKVTTLKVYVVTPSPEGVCV